MSKNVEVVRRFLDAYVDGDYERAAGELHTEAEWHNTPSFPGPGAVRGPAAIRSFWHEMFRAFSGSSKSGSGMEVEKITEIDDVVVVRLHGWGGGTTSGVPFDRHWAHTFRFQGAKVRRIDTYGSYRRALEANGLREPAD